MGKTQEEFRKRGVKIVALSLNDVDAHKEYVLWNTNLDWTAYKVQDVSESIHGMQETLSDL